MIEPNQTAAALLRASVRTAAPTSQQSRLTGQITIHHEAWGEDPVTGQATFSQVLATLEEPWTRKITLGPEWVCVADLGSWVANVGYMLIMNRTGGNALVKPTEEEANALQKKIVGIGYGGTAPTAPENLVRPGRFGAIEVFNAKRVWLRSQHEEARATLFLFPR